MASTVYNDVTTGTARNHFIYALKITIQQIKHLYTTLMHCQRIQLSSKVFPNHYLNSLVKWSVWKQLAGTWSSVIQWRQSSVWVTSNATTWLVDRRRGLERHWLGLKSRGKPWCGPINRENQTWHFYHHFLMLTLNKITACSNINTIRVKT